MSAPGNDAAPPVNGASAAVNGLHDEDSTLRPTMRLSSREGMEAVTALHSLRAGALPDGARALPAGVIRSREVRALCEAALALGADAETDALLAHAAESLARSAATLNPALDSLAEWETFATDASAAYAELLRLARVHGAEQAAKEAAARWADLGRREDREQLRTMLAALDSHLPSQEGCGSPILRRMDTVQEESLRWLWPGRIPRGKLSLLSGAPGLGKSLVTIDIAARVTTGQGYPDGAGAGEPGGVVLLNAEDDAGDTIKPRLLAAGADCARVVLLEAIRRVDPGTSGELSGTFDLGRDLDALRKAIQGTPNCSVVVIDPISAYIGKVDSHRNAELRGLLAPLAKLAADTGVSILAVTHLRKGSNNGGAGSAIDAPIGSIATIAAARSAYQVTRDPEDRERRLFLPVKSNLAADAHGLSYRVRPPRPGQCAPSLDWDPEPVEISADEALSSGGRHESSEVDHCANWLRDHLAYGHLPAKTVKEDAKAAGFSEATLRRARIALRAVSVKNGLDGGWSLGLPGTEAADPKALP